ncbi:DUF1684 domain-containing protein [Umezawaea endophytica]|uniref:DUF1684 domain-containing protein n=1 Tax=Umezawaea endophytica TaxID=1654476 RepID=A0A9X3AFH6_9PSEU|nr:DUF1684 domain-containing protein [Umezawaea endophytica]MCS7477210.1 DUF1684 domain-containing protein [Umezawaea endophytica]
MSADLQADWTEWHDRREAVLRQPHGWLSLTGLLWLDSTPRRFPGVPGEWVVAGAAARVTASAADGLVVDGAVLDGTASVEVAEQGSTLFAAYGDVLVEVARRSGRYVLRPRDPNSPTRTAFTGVPAFAVRPEFVVDAEFRPYDAPRTVVVGSAQEGLEQETTVDGELVFTLGGVKQTVAASVDGDSVGFRFSDATSGTSTAAWRSLSGPLADGRAVLDFNRATNMPFTFSPYGTCPRPPEGNVLPVAVEAGELKPV